MIINKLNAVYMIEGLLCIVGSLAFLFWGAKYTDESARKMLEKQNRQLHSLT